MSQLARLQQLKAVNEGLYDLLVRSRFLRMQMHKALKRHLGWRKEHGAGFEVRTNGVDAVVRWKPTNNQKAAHLGNGD